MSKKLTFEYVREYIKSFGCDLLSKEYKRNNSKIRIKCRCGNEFETTLSSFKVSKKQCSICEEIDKRRLFALKQEEVEIKINSLGYELLSEYKNAMTKLKLKCSKGHIFEATYNNFINKKSRCPICAKNHHSTYEEVNEYFKKFNYQLLSKTYDGCNEKLDIICDRGHKIKMTFSSFKQGNRCSICRNEMLSKKFRDTIENVREFITSVGYVLKSTEYKNSNEYLIFQCPVGHEFSMKYKNFKHGQRCPICAIEVRRQKKLLNYDFVYDFIKNTGYNLISTEYKGIKSKLKIQCSEGHLFEMNFDSFKIGKRCPICNSSKGETKIEECLNLYNINYQPQFSFDDCKNIELLKFDFAIFNNNSEMLFLVEYQGQQHYEPVDFAGKGEEWAKINFEGNQKRDKIKVKYCQQNNIPLLRIPYWDFDNIEQILLQQLNNHDLKTA